MFVCVKNENVKESQNKIVKKRECIKICLCLSTKKTKPKQYSQIQIQHTKTWDEKSVATSIFDEILFDTLLTICFF